MNRLRCDCDSKLLPVNQQQVFSTVFLQTLPFPDTITSYRLCFIRGQSKTSKQTKKNMETAQLRPQFPSERTQTAKPRDEAAAWGLPQQGEGHVG